jgi:glutathione synthase/RimK-type ligase-like ATP-grasp enzyme
MNICLIHPAIAAESAKELADACGFAICNPFKEDKRDFRQYDGVFNYGCNRKIVAKNIVNTTRAVATCINKIATYEVFKKAGIPTVEYRVRPQDVPAVWNIVVVRDKVDGAKAEGLDYHYQSHEYKEYVEGKPVPDGKLFSEFFDHIHEYRVMVFCGKCVGVYNKARTVDGQWLFEPVEDNNISVEAVKAAKALDIDFVGFDVLVSKQGRYKFLEANTGPVLTAEMIDAVKGYLK